MKLLHHFYSTIGVRPFAASDLKEKWRDEETTLFLHKGKYWDAWRAEGLPDETSREMW